MLPTITLADLLTGIGTVAAQATTGITPFVIVAIGFPLAFYVLKRVISLVPKTK